MRARVTRLVAAASVGVVLVLSGPLPARAAPGHGGAGQISLVQTRVTGPDTVAVEVCVTFVLDREQADTARVTLGATGPGDLEVDDEPMKVGDQPGLRTGELTLPEPGSWTLRVASTFPPAELAVPVTLDPDVPPQAAVPAAPAGGSLGANCEPEGGGAPAWLVAGAGTAAAVVIFGGLLLLLRRATAPALED